jgi:8-oxo-dGTP diphosphatase
MSSIELIARAVLISGDCVLMCQNLKKGYYYLPGGHIDPSESAAAAVARELVEEAGLKVRVGGLLAVAEVAFGKGAKRTQEINLVFHVEHGARGQRSQGPVPVVSLEKHLGFAWVPLDGLDAMDVRPGVLARWLSDRKGRLLDARRSAVGVSRKTGLTRALGSAYDGTMGRVDHLVDLGE